MNSSGSPLRVLNVGGNNKGIELPSHFAGWKQDLLDIDPSVKPDVLCDARDLVRHGGPTYYDAVYCSHNLEHYFPHEIPRVLDGFDHVLRQDGFIELVVPDVGTLVRLMVEHDLDFDDPIIDSPGGLIKVSDVIWGWGREIEVSGSSFFAHKFGFSQKSFGRLLASRYPAYVVIPFPERLELRALAFLQAPTSEKLLALGVPA